MRDKELLIGNWELKKFRFIANNNEDFFPFGTNPKGLLIYTDNGLMTAQLGNPNRKNSSNDNYLNVELIEKSNFYDGYISYFGSWTINEDSKYILHDVKMSLFPNWVGKKVKRNYKFSNQALILTASELEFNGNLFIPELTWIKIR